MKKDYLSVVYDKKRTPKTDYPVKLAEYLVNRFYLKKAGKFLEIGCGRGDFLNAFYSYGLDCYGVDIEKKNIEISSAIDVRQCDLTKEKLPFADNSFDTVYHKSLIEHLLDPQNLMEETYRVLKDGGRLIILTPDWQSQMRVFYEDFTHRRPYTKEALSDLLEMCGFKDIVSEKFIQLPSVWRSAFIRFFSGILSKMLSVGAARWLTRKTGIKLFRFSVELMILGSAKK